MPFLLGGARVDPGHQFRHIGARQPLHVDHHGAIPPKHAGQRVVIRTRTRWRGSPGQNHSHRSRPGAVEDLPQEGNTGFTQPVGVLMTAVVHFVADESDPWGIVASYLDAVAPGSYLPLSHATHENLPPRAVLARQETYARATAQLYLRSRAEVARFFDGLELEAPYAGAERAVTYAGLWGAEDPESADSDGSRAIYCGLARRP